MYRNGQALLGEMVLAQAPARYQSAAAVTARGGAQPTRETASSGNGSRGVQGPAADAQLWRIDRGRAHGKQIVRE